MKETKKDDNQPYNHYQQDNYPTQGGAMDNKPQKFKKVDKR